MRGGAGLRDRDAARKALGGGRRERTGVTVDLVTNCCRKGEMVGATKGT